MARKCNGQESGKITILPLLWLLYRARVTNHSQWELLLIRPVNRLCPFQQFLYCMALHFVRLCYFLHSYTNVSWSNLVLYPALVPYHIWHHAVFETQCVPDSLGYDYVDVVAVYHTMANQISILDLHSLIHWLLLSSFEWFWMYVSLAHFTI